MNKLGDHSRPEIAADVRRAVARGFAEADRPAVLAALERYRSGRDVARVHRAILILSYCDIREVERLVEMAYKDRRDLIRLAESPERSGAEDEPDK